MAVNKRVGVTRTAVEWGRIARALRLTYALPRKSWAERASKEWSNLCLAARAVENEVDHWHYALSHKPPYDAIKLTCWRHRSTWVAVATFLRELPQALRGQRWRRNKDTREMQATVEELVREVDNLPPKQAELAGMWQNPKAGIRDDRRGVGEVCGSGE